MSNEIEDQEDLELKAMAEQIEQAAEAQRVKAAQDEAPSPEPVVPSQAPEPTPQPIEPVTPTQSKPAVQAEDDPMEWAKKKGLKSPEDMARALQQKEQEFHKRNQAGHPGYQDIQPTPQTPVNPNWQPRPDWQPQPNYGYQPQPQRGGDYRDVAAMYPQLDPNDVQRMLPLIVDAAETIANRKVAAVEQRFGQIERTTMRNNELMSLMQDPAFSDHRVQKEIHSVLDSDPTIFQRERAPLAYAYDRAMVNLARKTIQTGVTPETKTPTPPVTAGGGNGSAFSAPHVVSQAQFSSWTDAEQDAYMKSKGRIVPKR